MMVISQMSAVQQGGVQTRHRGQAQTVMVQVSTSIVGGMIPILILTYDDSRHMTQIPICLQLESKAGLTSDTTPVLVQIFLRFELAVTDTAPILIFRQKELPISPAVATIPILTFRQLESVDVPIMMFCQKLPVSDPDNGTTLMPICLRPEPGTSQHQRELATTLIFHLLGQKILVVDKIRTYLLYVVTETLTILHCSQFTVNAAAQVHRSYNRQRHYLELRLDYS